MNKGFTIAGATAILGLLGAFYAIESKFPVSAETHYADIDRLACKLAWIEYESVKRKVDNADHRAAENDTERNRTDVTKYNVDLVKALKEIEKVC